jgi:hypothetical protein
MIADDEIRALELYRLALSLVEAKGRSVSVGLTDHREFREGSLTIIYLPKSSHLDVWHRRKVLTINQRGKTPKVTYYSSGEWEEELQEEARSALKSA